MARPRLRGNLSLVLVPGCFDVELACVEVNRRRAESLQLARHTFASLLIASGSDALQVKKAMGHSTIKVTYDLYGHLFPEGRETLGQRVDAYIAAQVRGTTTGQ